jgi:hypothetical protein
MRAFFIFLFNFALLRALFLRFFGFCFFAINGILLPIREVEKLYTGDVCLAAKTRQNPPFFNNLGH